MKSKRKGIKNPKPRQRVTYYPPSDHPYEARVKQVDRRDQTVFIELKYDTDKWMTAWVSFADVEAVTR